MNCVFNTITKKFTGTAIRWDIPEITADEIIIVLPDVPDNTVRLNAANNAVRPATPVELGEIADQRKDAQVKAEFTPAMEAMMLVLDPADGAAKFAQAKAARRNDL